MKSLEAKLLHPVNPFKIYTVSILLNFVIITVLNWRIINMPPVWDAASGIFSPAIYLYDNHFNFSKLKKLEGYITGGPNVHSFSLVGFITVLVISLTQARIELFLPILHLIHFAFSAAVLTCVFFITLELMGLFLAIATCLSLLFYPLFLVQTGYLYTEIPGSALFLCAIFAWAKRYFLLAILFGAAACMVKSFGIVLMVSLSILFLFDITLSKRRRLMWCCLSIIAMVTVEMMRMNGFASGYSFDRSNYFDYFINIFIKLNLMPDLKIIIVIILLTPCIIFLKQKSQTKVLVTPLLVKLVSGDFSNRIIVAIYFVPIVFLSFVATVPLTGMFFAPLLRYYIWVLPLMFIGVVYAGRLFLGGTFKQHGNLTGRSVNNVLAILLVGLTFFFITNRNGHYYPSLGDDTNSFSSAERSFEYLDFYKIQRDSVMSLAELQNDLPAFVTRGEYYYLSSPLMGYVKKQVGNVFLILNKPFDAANLADFPGEFILLDISTQPMHGGEVVKQLLANARSDSRYSVSELVRHQNGSYKSVIYRISRTDSSIDSGFNH